MNSKPAESMSDKERELLASVRKHLRRAETGEQPFPPHLVLELLNEWEVYLRARKREVGSSIERADIREIYAWVREMFGGHFPSMDQLAREFHRRCASETNAWRSMEGFVPTVEPPTFVLIAERKRDGSYVAGEARWFGDQGWRWAGNDPTDHWGREVYPEYWMPLPSPPGSALKTSALNAASSAADSADSASGESRG